ncbi:hypothetical protein DL96DRAFT_1580569 [Flagelloscypha sp. PMI_526]|nr:hypothetical protein DL96DRAFT_1580569 [Flagelloscypha sp. PMI_526]
MRNHHSAQFLLLDHLPLDLARYVVDLAASDLKTALALVFTSKQLSTWAIPHLYQRVFLKDQVALDQFKAALDACPSRGSYVKTLSLATSRTEDDHSLNISILTKTSSLVHLTWTETRPFGESLPVECFPLSLRHLNVRFLGFHPSSWDNSRSFPSSSTIETLQITALFDFAESPAQHISLSSFSSLKYLLFRSNSYNGDTSQFNAWLVSVLIPSFPDTLRVCVIFDRIYTGSRIVSGEMKALIMGAIDDRILVCTDKRISISPRGILQDFLIQWDHDYLKSPFINASSPPASFDSMSAEQQLSSNIPSWKDLELLVKRRKARREQWFRIFPTGRVDEGIYRVVDYPWRRTALQIAGEVAMVLPALVIMGGEAIWKQMKRLSRA